MFLLPNTDCISFLLIHFASLLSASFHLSTSLATLHDFPITKLCFCDSLPRATTQRSPALTHSSTFNTRQLHKLTHAYYTYTYLVPYTCTQHPAGFAHSWTPLVWSTLPRLRTASPLTRKKAPHPVQSHPPPRPRRKPHQSDLP